MNIFSIIKKRCNQSHETNSTYDNKRRMHCKESGHECCDVFCPVLLEIRNENNDRNNKINVDKVFISW